MSANLREATTSDVADVRRVARESWHAAYDDIVGADAVESVVDDWYDLYALRQSVEREDGLFLVAECETDPGETAVVGFAQGLDAEDGAAELTRIYVHPDCWGEGVGSAMLDRVESWAADRGAERLRLLVLADNEVGNAFYEARGYRAVGSRESEFEGETYTDYVREKEL